MMPVCVYIYIYTYIHIYVYVYALVHRGQHHATALAPVPDVDDGPGRVVGEPELEDLSLLVQLLDPRQRVVDVGLDVGVVQVEEVDAVQLHLLQGGVALVNNRLPRQRVVGRRVRVGLRRHADPLGQRRVIAEDLPERGLGVAVWASLLVHAGSVDEDAPRRLGAGGADEGAEERAGDVALDLALPADGHGAQDGHDATSRRHGRCRCRTAGRAAQPPGQPGGCAAGRTAGPPRRTGALFRRILEPGAGCRNTQQERSKSESKSIQLTPRF